MSALKPEALRAPLRGRLAGGRLLPAGAGLWVALIVVVLVQSWTRLAGSDWTPFAVGGRLVLSQPARLYQRAAQLSEQLRLIHATFTAASPGAVHGLLPVIAPPWVNLLASPFTLLGYTTGGKAWVLVELLALLCAGLLITGWRDAHRALIALGGLPAFELTMNGQVDGLVALGVALAWRLYRRNNQFSAGLALTLALAKPQLVLALAAGLIVTRRWRVLAGWTVGGLSLVAASTAVEPALVPEWIRYAFGNAGHIGYDVNLAGATDLLAGGWAGSLVAAAIGIGVTLWFARGRTLGNAAGLLLIGGLLAAPHALPTDLVLVPIGLLAAGRDTLLRVGLVSAGTFVLIVAPELAGRGFGGHLVVGLVGSLLLMLLMIDLARPLRAGIAGALVARLGRGTGAGAGPTGEPASAGVRLRSTEVGADR